MPNAGFPQISRTFPKLSKRFFQYFLGACQHLNITWQAAVAYCTEFNLIHIVRLKQELSGNARKLVCQIFHHLLRQHILVSVSKRDSMLVLHALYFIPPKNLLIIHNFHFPTISRSWKIKEKIHDFPGLSRKCGNPVNGRIVRCKVTKLTNEWEYFWKAGKES